MSNDIRRAQLNKTIDDAWNRVRATDAVGFFCLIFTADGGITEVSDARAVNAMTFLGALELAKSKRVVDHAVAEAMDAFQAETNAREVVDASMRKPRNRPDDA